MGKKSKILFPKKSNQLSGEGSIFFITLMLIILGSLAFVGGLSSAIKNPSSSNKGVIIQDAPASSPGYTLQLKNLSAVTPSPTPTPTPTPPPLPTPTPINSCNHDSGTKSDPTCKNCPVCFVTCQNELCIAIDPIKSGNCNLTCDIFNRNNWCKTLANQGDGNYCLYKPVIYLYPKEKTLVDVSVETSGKVVVSDPLYPIGGWKNVLAYPDGKLIYKDKEYRELFYESSISNIKAPEGGIVVKKKNIEKTLKDLTNKLGLIPNEQKELIDFWMMKLNDLNSPYMFISIVDRQEKEKTDKININPKPDTIIDFLLYFKPLGKFVETKPLELPQTAKRIGFTSVEWGGTIDNN